MAEVRGEEVGQGEGGSEDDLGGDDRGPEDRARSA